MTSESRREALVRDLAAMSDSEFADISAEARRQPDSLQAAMEAAVTAIRGHHR
jgi:hypothetical protein